MIVTPSVGADRVVLNPNPTPIHSADRMRSRIGGPELWIKRDDLIPFGCGGNKVRGLELIVADALRSGADTLVTGAGVLSNHVRATAAAAAYAGMKMIAVYWGKPPKQLQGNHKLCELMGAEFRFTGSLDRSSVDPMLETVANGLREDGRRPYVIPRGGACTLGVIAHVNAVAETLSQCRKAGISPSRVIMAVGSGGTYAGWVLGSAIHGAPWTVEAITVSRPAEEAERRVNELIADAARELGVSGIGSRQRIVIHDGYIGEGYGIPSRPGQNALSEMACSEGIFLDPTYTAKAMAGYGSLIGSGRFDHDNAVLFLHSGGLPAVFVAGDSN